jgi:4-alpha-glucanotransferase
MDSKKQRFSGVLLHPTSLYTPYGIGDFGPAAYGFVRSLTHVGVKLWQVLPLGPTGYGNSPYAARSSFAGNELMISPELLVREGWLSALDIEQHPSFPDGKVDYNAVIRWKLPLLKRAAKEFLTTDSVQEDFGRFCEENSDWLDDYALFMVEYEQYQDARWFSHWDPKVAHRDPVALAHIEEEHTEEIEVWKALQYLYERQWLSLKRFANEAGVEIIGDIPIFVASDSADTWSHIDLFQTDANGRYRKVSGVPPDRFCATGQLWGNPIYDWEKMKKNGYAWWIRRLKRLASHTDYIRIDHFRGFESYWSVPAGDKTAEHGVWVKGPGQSFFDAVRAQLPNLKIIAEDLGFMTPEVEKLRDDNDYPGMRIATFGFNRKPDGTFDAEDTFLPHNYGYRAVVYPGTHDNDTIKGWFDKLGKEDQSMVMGYLGCAAEEVPHALVRALMASHAEFAIFQLQDILGLGSEARMNTPSTCGDQNWSWQLGEKDNIEPPLQWFHQLVKWYGR